MSKKKSKPTVVGLFSGCGGLDLGFKQAGFDILWANDFDKDSVETYKNNIGDHIVLGDITQIPSKKFHLILMYCLVGSHAKDLVWQILNEV